MNRTTQWGVAWIGLVMALALHVTDEALTGFLPLYNATVESLRASWAWFPMPTFTFRGWLGGLIAGIAILLALSPLAFAGRRGLAPFAYFLGALMAVNALAHIGLSVYLGRLVPGVYSSPVLLAAAALLLVTTARR